MTSRITCGNYTRTSCHPRQSPPVKSARGNEHLRRVSGDRWPSWELIRADQHATAAVLAGDQRRARRGERRRVDDVGGAGARDERAGGDIEDVRLLIEADRDVRPLGENASADTSDNAFAVIELPVGTDETSGMLQNRTMPSSVPTASKLPAGLKRTAHAAAEGPVFTTLGAEIVVPLNV